MMRRVLAILIVIASAIALAVKPDPSWTFAEQPMARVGTGAMFETVFDYTSPEGTGHSPAIAPEPRGNSLLWFDGIHESHTDVRILKSEGLTDETHELMTRQGLSEKFVPTQTILTLGNTIADNAGESYFTTVVTLGGWAAASVAHVTDAQARKLDLSPFIARSHLIRSPVIDMQGGGVLLPSYFEMSKGYSVAALLDRDRRVIGQSVMRGPYEGIQPMIVPYSDQGAVALIRRFDEKNDRLLASWTETGGREWSAPIPLDLPNPNSPVAAVPLETGEILMLYNDHPEKADVLRFAVSQDKGRSWTPGRILDGPGKGNLRYPMMRVLDDGAILATYSTRGKSAVVAHVFSADWAMQK